MDVSKIQVKLFAAQDGGHALPAFVPVFHEWIRKGTLAELMIDVAPYDHVKDGPGILFVGHGSDYYIDEGKGRRGLLYSRKREAPAPAERLRDAVRRVLHVATLLEKEPDLAGLVFDTGTFLIRLNDRLGAPSTAETFAKIKPEVDAFFKELFPGKAVDTTLTSTEKELLSMTVKLGASPERAEALLGRLGGAPRD